MHVITALHNFLLTDEFRLFEPPLIIEMNCTVMDTSFNVKCHFLICFFVKLDIILHYQNVNLLKHIGLNSKHTINPAEQRHVISCFKMLDHAFNYLKDSGLLVTSHGFDYEIIITRKEEKGAGFSSSLT